MTAQSPLAGSQYSQLVERARQEIERLVRERLVGRKIDAITFVEELLTIAGEVGVVRCSPAADQGLRFELCSSTPFEIALDGNRGKLRMLCARLAVLCQESGHDFQPYGGEGTIRRGGKADLIHGESPPLSDSRTWKVRWTNTPGNPEFTIQSAVRWTYSCQP